MPWLSPQLSGRSHGPGTAEGAATREVLAPEGAAPCSGANVPVVSRSQWHTRDSAPTISAPVPGSKARFPAVRSRQPLSGHCVPGESLRRRAPVVPLVFRDIRRPAYAAVAGRVRIPLATVTSRLHAARKRLSPRPVGRSRRG
ncbi:hypothetical protein GCM10010211_32780 [Streptomyces albospinus]|uniref:Uncharacterized protein n=1 Tax=Streptomyces albospinus TaxID=285515 RepID=A0ABQ2V210_9ACTN|nr:hypothetical protein GCM10010211_32780 [Streptomyces albospinus]